ncbi:MAG: GntR family transcriptional regulator [Rhodothermales bacterium]
MLQSGRPRHEQISDWLRQQIEKGEFGVDDQLPSENQLGQQFDVSRITVRRALQTLESEGLIYRRQGLGAFVKDARLLQGMVKLTDFVEDMAQAGLEASSRVVHFDQVEPPGFVQVALNVEPRVKVCRLDRLRLGDDLPIAFDQTWLPVFYGQLLHGYDLQHETIYRILEEDYEVPVLRGRYRLDAVNADEIVAGQLGVPVGRAVFLIERLSMTTGDKPVYVQRRYYRTDRVTYEIEVARRGGAARGSGMPLREFAPVFRSSQ